MEAIVIEQVKSFLTSLDWWYTITFILIVWLFARDQAVTVWCGGKKDCPSFNVGEWLKEVNLCDSGIS